MNAIARYSEVFACQNYTIYLICAYMNAFKPYEIAPFYVLINGVLENSRA